MQHHMLCVKGPRSRCRKSLALAIERRIRHADPGVSMMRADSRPERLGDVLRAVLDRLPVRERLREYAIWPHWEEAVGATIAQHAHPVRIRRGLLCVAVDSSVWMQELQFLKESIRVQLNTRVGQDIISDLFFILDGTRVER
jgi:predicted nucleic acid-binding Zn ribbon protein